MWRMKRKVDLMLLSATKSRFFTLSLTSDCGQGALEMRNGSVPGQETTQGIVELLLCVHTHQASVLISSPLPRQPVHPLFYRM